MLHRSGGRGEARMPTAVVAVRARGPRTMGTMRALPLVSFLLKCAVLTASAAIARGASKAPVCTTHDGLPTFDIAGKPPGRARGLTFCEAGPWPPRWDSPPFLPNPNSRVA